MSSGLLIMLNKRKREDTTAAAAESAGGSSDRRAKRQRLRTRSHSEPLRNHAVPPVKREALKRLFGRICAVDKEENQRAASDPEEEYVDFTEEEENSLVEDVPADMDPEQLGFLVCAQETLRFLNGLGITYQDPLFNHLRLHLLQGINEIGVA